MRKKILLYVILVLSLTIFLTGCNDKTNSNDYNESVSTTENLYDGFNESENKDNIETTKELNVSFGDNKEIFKMYLYDNDTSKAIAGFIGFEDLRLPIYHYNDYDNWEVMQYYDIPSSYNIPKNLETITSEKAGEVYFTEPNRIVLFYKDAEITGEYTKIGYFDYSEEFVSAVENNPVIEGWDNKVIVISKGN